MSMFRLLTARISLALETVGLYRAVPSGIDRCLRMFAFAVEMWIRSYRDFAIMLSSRVIRGRLGEPKIARPCSSTLRRLTFSISLGIFTCSGIILRT